MDADNFYGGMMNSTSPKLTKPKFKKFKTRNGPGDTIYSINPKSLSPPSLTTRTLKKALLIDWQKYSMSC